MYFIQKGCKIFGIYCFGKGITTDLEKITAVGNLPIPHNKKQVRSVFVFIRKFVKGFSLIVKPLYSLIKNSSKFKWKAQC